MVFDIQRGWIRFHTSTRNWFISALSTECIGFQVSLGIFFIYRLLLIHLSKKKYCSHFLILIFFIFPILWQYNLVIYLDNSQLDLKTTELIERIWIFNSYQKKLVIEPYRKWNSSKLKKSLKCPLEQIWTCDFWFHNA